MTGRRGDYCGVMNETCPKCDGTGVELADMTNADRIRAMNDEKLAEAFFNLCENLNDGTMNDLSDLYCDGKNGCVDKDGNITCTPDMEKACVLRWFQQPVEEISKWPLKK